MSNGSVDVIIFNNIILSLKIDGFFKVIMYFQQFPPVRSKLKKKKNIQNDKNSQNKKIKSWDYKAWDKFDVVSISRSDAHSYYSWQLYINLHTHHM